MYNHRFKYGTMKVLTILFLIPSIPTVLGAVLYLIIFLVLLGKIQDDGMINFLRGVSIFFLILMVMSIAFSQFGLAFTTFMAGVNKHTITMFLGGTVGILISTWFGITYWLTLRDMLC